MIEPNRTAPESAANAYEGLARSLSDQEGLAPMLDPSPHERVALIRSIVNHATDDERALDEVRAVLAGGGIDDILILRGEG